MLRYAVRTDGKSGFLFINNYQDHIELKDKKDECIEITVDKLNILINNLAIAAGESAILPINIDLDGIKLLYATAQPLSRIETKDCITYIFFEPDGMKAHFFFEDGEICDPKVGKENSFTKKVNDKSIKFIVLSREESLCYNEFDTDDGTIAFISEDTVTFDGKCFYVEKTGQNKRRIDAVPCGMARYTIDIPKLNPLAKDTLLQINYSGDIGNLFDESGYLLEDNFSNDGLWEIGLNELGINGGERLTLYISPKKDGVVVDTSSTMAGRLEKVDDARFLLEEVTLVETHTSSLDISSIAALVK